ncbi:MAG: serine/threonine-protein kinase [Rubrobacteraceae bacterium]
MTSFEEFTDTGDEAEDGPPPMEAGEVLAAGYTVITHLHRSNSFDVYDAWSEERACRCIAKAPIPSRAGEAKTVRSLFREGRLLRKLTHPHIVRAYEVIREPRPVVILETLTGATLSHLIDTAPRRLSLAEITHLGLHLCSAVRYLHHHDILHLDLKPSNIVSERGMAKILDLSIARKPGRGAKGAGTIHYLSPEQARGDIVGPPADVWGIGATLYESLTGELPFHAESLGTDEDTGEYEQLLRRVEPIHKHRRTPKPLAEAISECLEPAPEDRPTLVELTEKLEEFATIRAF